MNLLQKLLWYIRLKKKNYRNAFITSFGNNKLTFGDWYFIVLVIGLILIAITLEFSEKIDANINQAKKTAINARYAQLEAINKLHEREKVLVTFLNGDYVRIDNRLVRVKMCDASGSCE